MSEPQYAHYKYLPRESLGLMSNETWQRDPKMLGIHLARYKFVAKMLAGRKRVSEVGCGDGWYTRIVRETVGLLSAFDFDLQFHLEQPSMIGRHDILVGHLPYAPYDAVYSLDVMEHISQKRERQFLENIKQSLAPHGTFIIGMPSLESQPYASPASKEGHVNCKSGADLKALLEEHFHNVFMFGMNDETIHTGFFPMCHYLLAICCGVK